jgi:GNAT superfamily N-acetyltransferase
MTPETMYKVVEDTWPPLSVSRLGPWTIRNGAGGGKRVSAATAEATVTAADLAQAEQAMADLGQTPLFMVRDGERALDDLLAAQGYAIVDPVVLYRVELGKLTVHPVPPVSAFTIWPPLAIMADIWAKGGTGPARLAVMERTICTKTGILARHSDQPAGAAFVALRENIAMIHAIEVAPEHRRHGVGRNMLIKAAHWAQDQGATHLSLAVTRANTGANALYSFLGMTVVGNYHYRIKQG